MLAAFFFFFFFFFFCLPSEMGILTVKKLNLTLWEKKKNLLSPFREAPFIEGALYAGKQTGTHSNYTACK